MASITNDTVGCSTHRNTGRQPASWDHVRPENILLLKWCQTTARDLDWVLSSWIGHYPASAAMGILGVNWQIEETLCLSLSLCLCFISKYLALNTDNCMWLLIGGGAGTRTFRSHWWCHLQAELCWACLMDIPRDVCIWCSLVLLNSSDGYQTHAFAEVVRECLWCGFLELPSWEGFSFQGFTFWGWLFLVAVPKCNI